MMSLQISGYALRAEPSLVNRKVVARFEADQVSLFNEQVQSALNGAVWAMCWNHFVNNTVRMPAAYRGIVKVRSELIYYPV